MRIEINYTDFETDKKVVSYEDILCFRFGFVPDPVLIYSVIWFSRTNNMHGRLTPGQSIPITDAMYFEVMPVSKH